MSKVGRKKKKKPHNQKEYYAEWYKEHKEDLALKRRLKYALDAEYREKCKLRAKDYNRKVRAADG